MVMAARQSSEYYRLGLQQTDPCSPLALAIRVKMAKLYLLSR
jgi:hypothetical protein